MRWNKKIKERIWIVLLSLAGLITVLACVAGLWMMKGRSAADGNRYGMETASDEDGNQAGQDSDLPDLNYNSGDNENTGDTDDFSDIDEAIEARSLLSELSSDHILPGGLVDASVNSPEEARKALDILGDDYGYEDAENVFAEEYTRETGLFTVYHFSQRYSGLKVAGHTMNVIVDDDGTVLNLAGNYVTIRDLPTEPEIDAGQAAARANVQSEDYRSELCVYVPEDNAHKVQDSENGSQETDAYLAWKIISGFHEFYVDAQTGELLGEFDLLSEYNGVDQSYSDFASQSLTAAGQDNSICSVNVIYSDEDDSFYLIDNERDIRIYDVRQTDDLEKMYVRKNLIGESSFSLPDLDASGVDAMYHLGQTYDFYREVLGHRSMDGNGKAPVYAGVHTEDYADNAGGGGDPDVEVGYMVFGVADQHEYEYSHDLPVVAHEFTHGVQTFVLGEGYKTSEGHAICEAMSDIMGALCLAYYQGGSVDWDDVREGIQSPGDGQIAVYDQYTANFNSHDASTLVSHVAYLINTQPELGSSYAVKSVETMAELWYHSLYLLNPYSGFSDLRMTVETIAQIMMGKGKLTADQYNGVCLAFEQSGIPCADELYEALDSTRLCVEVLDGNHGYEPIPYNHYYAVVADESGVVIKTVDSVDDEFTAGELIDRKEIIAKYFVILYDEYTDQYKVFRIRYYPDGVVPVQYHFSGGEMREDIQILTDFGRGIWVAGTVLDEDSEALEGVAVSLTNLDNLGRDVSVLTDEKGQYRVCLYYGTEPFTLTFQKEWMEETELTDTISEEEVARASETGDGSFTLGPVKMRYQYHIDLCGYVYDEEGKALAGVSVKAVSSSHSSVTTNTEAEDAGAGIMDMAVTDDSGYYHLTCHFTEGKITYSLNDYLPQAVSYAATKEMQEETSPENPYRLGDIKMQVRSASKLMGATDGSVFGSRYGRGSIRTITFRDSFDDMDVSTAWDVSKEKNQSVMAWVIYDPEETGSAKYDLFIASENIIIPYNGAGLFEDYSNVTSIDFNGCFDTEGVISLSSMFCRDVALRSVDVSSFHTSAATSMDEMFAYCNKLEELDVSNFDTGRVKDFSGMFNACLSLRSLDLTGWDTGSAKDMERMFGSCQSLTELDLSSFDTSKVTSMRAMFVRCTSLSTLNVTSFDTGNVTNMIGMFENCSSLENLDTSGFDRSNARIDYMFRGTRWE